MNLIPAQCRDKRDHDKNIRRTPAFTTYELVYMNKPPLAASSAKDTDSLAAAAYEKLMLQTIEVNPVIKMDDHTLVIHKNGIHNTLCIQRATLAPGQDNTLPLSSRTMSALSTIGEADLKKTLTEHAVHSIV